MQLDPPESPTRCLAIDVLKLLAAAAVVWIHVSNCEDSQQYLALCRFAVPFFTAAAVFYVLRKASGPQPPESFAVYCKQRALRLYVPFLIWALFYWGLRVAKHTAVEHGSPIMLTPAVLLNGTAHHLWFLPFICLVSMIAFVFGRWLRTQPTEKLQPLGMILLMAGTIVAIAPDPVDIRAVEAPITYFADHALDTLPSVFFGAAVFCFVKVFTPSISLRLAILAVALVCVAWEYRNGGHLLAPHLAGAALLFCGLTQANRSWMRPFGKWASLAFIIYLVHVLFVEALQVIQSRFGGVTSLPADLSVWALALVVSALTARMMQRARSLRWVFPQ